MRRLVTLALWFPIVALGQPSVVGDWSGEIQGTGLSVVFHIVEAEGGLSSTLDVPAQGAAGVPTASTTLAGDSLTITLPQIGGRYDAVADDGEIRGMWTQGGGSLPLVLTPLEAGAAALPERADTPQPPFPYTDETVSLEAPGGVVLEGTLTLPEGRGPFPAAVLVTGSGPQNRDSELLGHRPFWVLADFLTRRGIAVLRYDERGVGASTGQFEGATTLDFAADAQAAAEWLASRPEVASVTVIGHSEGGLVAPIVANASDAVDAVVLLAGPGVAGREILRYQLTRDAAASDASGSALEALDAATVAMLDAVSSGDPATAADRAVAAFRAGAASIPEATRARLGLGQMESVAAGLAGPWERAFITYDPAPALEALEVPVLAVFGALDRQVRADDNVPAVEAALEGAPSGSRVVVLEGLNHLFQPTETGHPSEYGSIDSSFSPDLMGLVADWVQGP